MYENGADQRLTVIVLPMSLDLQGPQLNVTQGTLNGCGWIENGLAFG